METETILDPVAFNDALDMFGHDGVRSHCTQFLREFRACMESMDQQPERLNTTELADKVHRILGPCGIFGASGLYDIACSLETELRTNTTLSKLRREEALNAAMRTEQAVVSLTTVPLEA